MKTIEVRDIRNNPAGFRSLGFIAKQAADITSDCIILDFSTCSFFEANMAAPLYSILSNIYGRLNRVSFSGLTAGVRAILRKNHFLVTILGDSPLEDLKQTTIPFRIFKLSAGEQFNDYLVDNMQGHGIPAMSPALTKKFRQSLFEIFQNAAFHSDSGSGIFTCGQFFPQKGRLDFTIADAGIGIRQNVRRYTGNASINSCDAIKWAMQRGNSTRIGSQPGGLGLDLIKDFIRLNSGKLQIVSRMGYYEFTDARDTFTELEYDFRGTVVTIEINTNDSESYCLKSEL